MFKRNNLIKKGLLLFFSSAVSCNVFAMESAEETSNFELESISPSIIIKKNSGNTKLNTKSNIRKLFDEISKKKEFEEKCKTDPRYYNEIGLQDFLNNYNGLSDNITRDQKLRILKNIVNKLYSAVKKWCYLNIEDHEELSENIYKLINNYNDKMLEWWNTPLQNKTNESMTNIKHEARVYINKNEGIWAFVRGPKGLFRGTLLPEGVENFHILEFGFDKDSNRAASGSFKYMIMRILRATVTFKTQPFIQSSLIDKEKQIWSDKIKYEVAPRYEKDNNGNIIRLNPYEIKLSFHYGKFDKNEGKEYIVRDLYRFLKN